MFFVAGNPAYPMFWGMLALCLFAVGMKMKGCGAVLMLLLTFAALIVMGVTCNAHQ